VLLFLICFLGFQPRPPRDFLKTQPKKRPPLAAAACHLRACLRHVTRSKTSDGPVRTSKEALSLERAVPEFFFILSCWFPATFVSYKILFQQILIPIGSMYGIYANICGILMVNVTIYSIHGSYGIWYVSSHVHVVVLVTWDLRNKWYLGLAGLVVVFSVRVRNAMQSPLQVRKCPTWLRWTRWTSDEKTENVCELQRSHLISRFDMIWGIN
jgi:hypothetical protein